LFSLIIRQKKQNNNNTDRNQGFFEEEEFEEETVRRNLGFLEFSMSPLLLRAKVLSMLESIQGLLVGNKSNA
jgi:hypothetical protein